MFGLSPLGTFHTAISLVAVAAGITALVRRGRIGSRSPAGQIYVWGTVLTCLTGFPIMRHGGFGPPHVLGVVTLGVLGAAFAAESGRWGGRGAPYFATVGYSATLFLHSIPAVTETATRLPAAKPFASGPNDPAIQSATAALFLLFAIGATVQVLRLRNDAAGARQP
jgi:hypothetical protein